MPVTLKLDRDINRRVVPQGFLMAHLWKLVDQGTFHETMAPWYIPLEAGGSLPVFPGSTKSAAAKSRTTNNLAVVPYLWGEGDRQFPSLKVAVTVRRRGGFYLLNVIHAAGSNPARSHPD